MPKVPQGHAKDNNGVPLVNGTLVTDIADNNHLWTYGMKVVIVTDDIGKYESDLQIIEVKILEVDPDKNHEKGKTHWARPYALEVIGRADSLYPSTTNKMQELMETMT